MSKLCPKCDTIHLKKGIFCSRKCANSRTFSSASNEKRKESLKNYWNNCDKEEFSKKVKESHRYASHRYAGPYTKIKLKCCNNCGIKFWSPGRTWCKDECYLAIKRKNWMGNKQRYDNENYDSSWEIELRDWFIQNDILFERPTISISWIDIDGKERKYFPDFYLPELKMFVDPKNPIVIKLQKEKLDYLSSRINLVYGSLDYIKQVVISASIPPRYERGER